MFTKQLSILLLVSATLSNANWFTSLTSKVANAASAVYGRSAQVITALPQRVNVIANETTAKVMPVVKEAGLATSNALTKASANVQNLVSANKEGIRGGVATVGLAALVTSAVRNIPAKNAATQQAVQFSPENEWNTAKDELSVTSIPAPYKSTNFEVVKQKLNSAKDTVVAAGSWTVTKVSNSVSKVWSFIKGLFAIRPTEKFYNSRVGKWFKKTEKTEDKGLMNAVQ